MGKKDRQKQYNAGIPAPPTVARREAGSARPRR